MNEGVLDRSLTRVKRIKPISKNMLFVIWLLKQAQTHWGQEIPDILALDRFRDEEKGTKEGEMHSSF